VEFRGEGEEVGETELDALEAGGGDGVEFLEEGMCGRAEGDGGVAGGDGGEGGGGEGHCVRLMGRMDGQVGFYECALHTLYVVERWKQLLKRQLGLQE